MSISTQSGRLSPEVLQERFDSAPRHSVGIEDEVMLLDPETLELAPIASELVGNLGGDARYKLELPASQLEIVAPPAATVPEVMAQLSRARRELSGAANGTVRLAGAGIHPFSSGVGELNHGPRYERIAREYGCIANRQLTCALQVHVSVGASDRALAIYNTARSYLPLLAALASNAPLYEGRDTGLASVRPKLAQLLPRQGLPPEIHSWEQYCEMLGVTGGRGDAPDPGTWWWELRPHAIFGTLEFRVPDGQTTLRAAGAIAAVIQSLVAWLAERHDAGEALPVDPSWRIEENRWSACRHGVEGTMIDVRSGERTLTRSLLKALLDALDSVADGLGCAAELAAARDLVAESGSMAQRGVATSDGPRGLADWLAKRFLDGATG